MELNDNDDTASVVADGRVVTLSGGAGSDTLSGANARLNASGGAGDDSLSGAGPNADVLAGNGGNDYVTDVAGPDAVDGGADVDTVSFAGQIAGIASRSTTRPTMVLRVVAEPRTSCRTLRT